MSHLPILGGREVVRALEGAGFRVVRQKGSPVRLRHPDGRVTTIPVYAGQDVSRGLLHRILRDAELTRDEFLDLLWEPSARGETVDSPRIAGRSDVPPSASRAEPREVGGPAVRRAARLRAGLGTCRTLRTTLSLPQR